MRLEVRRLTKKIKRGFTFETVTGNVLNDIKDALYIVVCEVL